MQNMWIDFLLVGLGAGLGTLFRVTFATWMKEKVNGRTTFPIATFLINISGSFCLGLLVGAPVENYHYLFLGTGFIGGFTTFASFKLESAELHRQKKHGTLWGYVLVSSILGLLVATLGIRIGENIIA